jgi:hypothetical protein
MGMSISLDAVLEPDDDWAKHRAVQLACLEAGVPVPDKTKRTLSIEDDDDEPPVAGQNVRLASSPDGGVFDRGHPCTLPINDGAIVKLCELPPRTAWIRLRISY